MISNPLNQVNVSFELIYDIFAQPVIQIQVALPNEEMHKSHKNLPSQQDQVILKKWITN